MIPGSASFSELRFLGSEKRGSGRNRKPDAPPASIVEDIELALDRSGDDLDPSVRVEVVGSERSENRLLRDFDLGRTRPDVRSRSSTRPERSRR
jgi:hypothetical protein